MSPLGNTSYRISRQELRDSISSLSGTVEAVEVEVVEVERTEPATALSDEALEREGRMVDSIVHCWRWGGAGGARWVRSCGGGGSSS